MPRGVYERTEEIREKISKTMTGRILSEEHKKVFTFKGKKHSEETRKKQKEARERYYRAHPNFNREENHPQFGKELSEEVRRKISETRKGKTLDELGHRPCCNCFCCRAARGENEGKKRPDHSEKMKNWENNPFKFKKEKSVGWKGGISFEPYGLEFNDELKNYIRQRDDFTCQFCGAEENGRLHTPHHINYDKKDNRERNLILLCTGCNSKANFNRNKWQFLFETLQGIRRI